MFILEFPMTTSVNNLILRLRTQNPEDLAVKQSILQRMEFLIKAVVDDYTPEDYLLLPGAQWKTIFEKGTSVKVIYYPEKLMSVLTDAQVIGNLLYEIAVVKYTTKVDPRIRVPEPRNIFGQVISAFEDLRVESKLIYRYPGTYDSFKRLKEYAIQVMEEEDVRKLPDHTNVLVNILRSRWKFEPIFSSKAAEDTFKKVKPYVYDLTYATENTSDLVRKVLKNVWGYFEDLVDQEQEDAKGDGDQQEEGDDTDNSDATDDSTQTKKQKNRAEKLKKITKSADFAEVLRDLQDISKKTLEAPKTTQEKKKEQDISLDLEDFEPEIERADKGADFVSYEQLYAQILPYYGHFVKVLNSVMKDNNYKRQGGTFLSGKLDHRKIFKVGLGDYKVFTKPVRRNHKKYSVCLLVDESGSMTQGGRNVNAAKTAVLFAEVLFKCGISFEVAAFNASTRIYKEYNAVWNWKARRNLENIIPNTHSVDGKDNNDGFAVNWATSRLQKQDGEKILIVISDGYPINSRGRIPAEDIKRLKGQFYTYSDFYLKTEVQKASKEVFVIGVGVQTPAVQNYYPKNVMLEDVSTLPKLIMQVLKKRIKRG